MEDVSFQPFFDVFVSLYFLFSDKAIQRKELIIKRITKILAGLMLVYMLVWSINCSKKSLNRDTVIFTDAMQRQVKVPKFVKRIVSMAPNVTEMLFALGLDNQIVGVTTYCNYPESAKNKAKIGGYYDPNIEVILSLKPDLIIATPDGYSKERIEKLDQTAIPIFIVNPMKIDDVMESVLIIGKVTGKEETAKQVIDKLSLRIKTLKDKVSSIPVAKRPKVFYQIGSDPLITVGPRNFVDDLITTAGGINIASDTLNSWPQYSVEAVIMKNPDIIITTPNTMLPNANPETQKKEWQKYRTISAVLNNKIYQIDPDILLRNGPRIVDGLEKLYEVFYK